MRYSWKHIKHIAGDFPEQFFWGEKSKQKNKKETRSIQVEVNRSQGRVRITCSSGENNSYQCVISNGTVLREKNLGNKKTYNIEKEITSFSTDISSLPDNQILELIGGNYGILTEFLGVIQKSENKKSSLKKIQTVEELLHFLNQKFQNLIIFMKDWFHFPSLVDVVDLFFALSFGFWVYQFNFSFLYTGLAMAFASLLTGYIDWLIRNRQPYILKIIVVFFPAMYISYMGYLVQ